MVKIITNQSGAKGFVCQGQFITDPYSSECMRSVVDPKQYYGLTDDELKKIIFDFEDLNNKEQGVAQYLFEKLKPSYESLLQVAYL